MSKILTGAVVATGILSMMPGCGPISVADYSGFVNIPSEGMPTGWEYEFSPEASDSGIKLTGNYDVIIAVRYTNQCPSKSVILNIEELSLAHEKPDSATVEIQLFDNDGLPLGKSRYGVNETFYTLRKDYKVPEGYVISISSPLSTEATAGVKAVGLLLEDEDNREKIKNKFLQLL